MFLLFLFCPTLRITPKHVAEHRINRGPVVLADVVADDGGVDAGGVPHLLGDVHHLEGVLAAVLLDVVVMAFAMAAEGMVRTHHQRVGV